MSQIKIEELTFAYPGSAQNVFENVSFQIDTDWRLGFVGRNGKGKTTLLNLMQGKYEYSGKISASVRFDYFPYRVEDSSRITIDILEEICPEAMEWEFMRELTLLKADTEILWRPFNTLSYGEKTKAMLAALFSHEGNFLLIDEPTNHLDVMARSAVAEYLKKKKGFILVSHDRKFLDECVDHILSLNRANIEVISGNFSTWFEEYQRRQKSEEAQNKRLGKEIEKMKEASRRAADWSDKVEKSKQGAFDRGYVGHKAAKMMKRSVSIENRRQKAIEQKSGLLKNAEAAEDLKLHPLEYHSPLLVSVKDAAAVYDNGAVSGEGTTFTVEKGERVVLDGINGCGKSSILKLICGSRYKYTGEIYVASGLKISYVPQDASSLCGTLYEVAEDAGINLPLFLAILRKMDFEREQFDRDIGGYSQGQKKKVLIAKSLCESAHLYVWDEPLNYIDIYSRMQIEKLISEFCPTMLMVEHDSAFRAAVATKTVRMS